MSVGSPLHCRLTLPQPEGGVRTVELEIPQRHGGEGMEVFERFCKRYGPKPEPDPAFDAILADDKARREKATRKAAKRKP